MHYYQWNIADYRKDAGHLSLLEHGIYRQLLDSYYLEEKPIETESVFRRLRINTDEEKAAYQNVVKDFFEVSDCGGYLIHRRAEMEIATYQAKADTARANGKKGGRPKKKTQTKQRVKETQNPTETQSVILGNQEKTEAKANHKPLTNNQELIKKTTPKNKFSDDDMVTAEFFYSSILKVQPDYKKPNLKSWANTVRLMRERDNRTLSDICAVWVFARSDPFWQQNILSADKLREKYDQLKAKMRAPHATSRSNNQSGRGLDPDDTSWIDPLFDDPSYGFGSPVGGQCSEPGNAPIEGDFSSVDGGAKDTRAGVGGSQAVAARVAGGRY